MPSLSFLKKKRTKDSSGSRSQPNSTPTSPTKPDSSAHNNLNSYNSSALTAADNRSSVNSSSAAALSPTTPTTSSAVAPNELASPSPSASTATTTPPIDNSSKMASAQTQPPYAQQQQQQQAVTSIQSLLNNPQPTHSHAHQVEQRELQQAQQAQQAGQAQPPQQQPQSHPLNQQSLQLQQPTPQTLRPTRGKYALGDFSILRTLGTGSFGRVHLVQSKHNQRYYAIKVLKKAQVVKMKQVEHTNDERRMLQKVKHPFLITLWGTFQDSRNLYMVMDFVEGGELFSLLRKSQRFPNPVAKFYAAEVTLALDYLHSMNMIYRDLKPENLLLDRHGHLKITDFGFAKEVPDITWTLCGTPDYLAPEVVSSKGYNKSVDWWSLGILIFEMLCGFTPFWDSGSPMRIYENILRGKVKYPSYIHPDAQDLLSKLITADLSNRLGNLVGGSRDVMNHRWFAEVTWDRLLRKDIDAPYVPPVRAGVGDASLFDRYPEETEAYGMNGDDPHGHLFNDF